MKKFDFVEIALAAILIALGLVIIEIAIIIVNGIY